MASLTCVPNNVSAQALPEIWGWEGWIMVVDLIAMFIILFNNIMPTEFAMLLALLVPVYFQFVTTAQALQGFSNSAVLAVAVLYAVAEAVTATGAMEYFMGNILGRPKSMALAQISLMLPVSLFSAFLNNTPVVALMLPIIRNWCRKCRWPVGQFMMPLSYATIMGGTVTLIGTSTNLVVAGKAEQYYCKSIGFFALTPIGVPVGIISFVYIFMSTKYLLPNKSVVESGGEKKDEETQFVVHCTVDVASQHVGVQPNAYLTMQPELRLMFVHRTGSKDKFAVQDLLKSAGQQALPKLESGDLLTFAVDHTAIDSFPEFCQNQRFTMIMEQQDTFGGAVVVQAVIPLYSHLEDKTAKSVQFRSTYNCAILSIFRKGEKIPASNLGEVELKVGDVLVLLTNDLFSWTNELTLRDLKPRPAVTKLTPAGSISSNAAVVVPNQADLEEVDREFQISMRIASTSQLQFARPLGGKTIEQAGLRGLPGLFLVAVSRGTQQFYAVGSDFVLEAEDIVWFIGERTSIATLRRLPGLQDVEQGQISKLVGVSPLERRLVECVLSLKSDLIGKTIKESRFRSRFNAAIVAIHRGDGKHQHSGRSAELNQVMLRAGDILILDTGPEFISKYRSDENFLLVSEIEDSTPPRFGHFYLALVCLIVMMTVVVAVPDNINLVFAALGACGIMLICRVLTPQRASSAVSWNVIITIAAAFGISNALENTLVAPVIGKALVSLAELTNTGEAGIVVCVYLATSLLSIVVANNAAAVLMFPIAAQAADSMALDPNRILLALMFAASASFMTPFGYQTNLMVMAPGGYVFKDYVRFGFPMQLIVFFTTVIFINIDEYWYVFLPLSIVFFVCMFGLKFAVLEGNGWRAFFNLFNCCCRCRRSTKDKTHEEDEKRKPETEKQEEEDEVVIV